MTDSSWALPAVAAARVGRLATRRPNGDVDLVPFVFAWLPGPDTLGRLVSSVDHKPKRHERLQRLANVAADERVTVLVDHYDEDWSTLWWVRLRGRALTIHDGPEHGAAIDALVDKYGQYRERRPGGAVLSIRVESLAAWAGGGVPDSPPTPK